MLSDTNYHRYPDIQSIEIIFVKITKVIWDLNALKSCSTNPFSGSA